MSIPSYENLVRDYLIGVDMLTQFYSCGESDPEEVNLLDNEVSDTACIRRSKNSDGKNPTEFA